MANIENMTLDTQHEIKKIKIFTSQQLQGMNHEVLGLVEGNSCQNKIWDPPATRQLAIEQAKFYAWEMDADGITDIKFGAREGTSLKTNCWELISCTALAIKVKK